MPTKEKQATSATQTAPASPETSAPSGAQTGAVQRSKAGEAASERFQGFPADCIPGDADRGGSYSAAGLATSWCFKLGQVASLATMLDRCGLSSAASVVGKAHSALLKAEPALAVACAVRAEEAGDWTISLTPEKASGNGGTRKPRIKEGDQVTIPASMWERLAKRGAVPAAQCTLVVDYVDRGKGGTYVGVSLPDGAAFPALLQPAQCTLVEPEKKTG